jgi:GT2 family glycosyltransferase
MDAVGGRLKPQIPLVEVSVVIGRREEHIMSCLRSLAVGWTGDPDRLTVTVIANCSSAEIIDRVHSEFPACKLIINEEGKGFAENHNMVLAQTSADYVLLLNDDVILKPYAIDLLVRHMDSCDNVAVVGPKLLNPDGTLQPSTYSDPTVLSAALALTGVRYLIPFNPFFVRLVSFFSRTPGATRFWAHNEECDVDTLKGACWLIRMDAVRDAGLMDEVTLAYGEETEWSRRLRECGWRVVFLPGAEAIHWGKESTRHLTSVTEELLKGFLNYFDKHGGTMSYLAFRYLIFLVWGSQWLFTPARRDHLQSLLRLLLAPDIAWQDKRRFFITRPPAAAKSRDIVKCCQISETWKNGKNAD